ncbi:MAG: DUF3179 domain-containing protein [Gemmatimonadaceae bacterium]|nr:DUF3179 domain-containing protein [Gemmatimonadaceae bacterium]
MTPDRFLRAGSPISSLVGVLSVVALSSCSGLNTEASLDPSECTVPRQFIADGGPGKDGIPALTNPAMVSPTNPAAQYLRHDDRIIGLQIGDEFIAVPLNIGWWHEVVNLNRGSLRLSITHCPLTGSSLVFNRSAVDGAEFGVSGLLFMNYLMLYDRAEPSSLWPQMSRGARCGSRAGTTLPMFPSVEMSWLGWRTLHPQTVVVSENTGHVRNYRSYPYGDYAREDNAGLLAPAPAIDARRPPKERVLGIVLEERGSLALPFGAMRTRGARASIPVVVGGESLVVLWDGARETAAAFAPRVDSQQLSLRVVGESWRDDETGSAWTVDGIATDGPLAGQRLTQPAGSFVAYWFAWAAFYPDAALWIAE